MPQFVTRVELHRATGEDYNRLHIEMGNRGFLRKITATNNAVYFLPTAEYLRCATTLTAEEVLQNARSAAATVSSSFGVLVVETEEPIRFFSLEPAT